MRVLRVLFSLDCESPEDSLMIYDLLCLVLHL